MPRKSQRAQMAEWMATWMLSGEQEKAVVLLAEGKTIAEIAECIEVDEHTVRSWRWEHPGVQAAMNSRRREAWTAVTDRLRALVPKALEVLERELEGETPLPAALHILKACGLYGLQAPEGRVEFTDPEEIAFKQAAHQQSMEMQRDRVLFGSY